MTMNGVLQTAWLMPLPIWHSCNACVCDEKEYLKMKLNGNAIKPGNVIEHKSRLWVAVKTSHVKPGKGGAFAQIELRDIRDGTKLNERFRATESVERVILDEAQCTYLYAEGDTHIFMHGETYEQISISAEMVGEPAAYLQDGMSVTLMSHEGEPISVSLPEQVSVTVVEADAVVKGQTASSSFKPAIVDNGLRVMVPPHIEAGTRIVVKTEDSTYVERAKD
jgi:elongation factor P